MSKKDDQDVILKRRSRLVQSALLAAGLAVGGVACSDEEPGPTDKDTSVGQDASGDVTTDTEPQVCLSVIEDTGDDSGVDDTSDKDTEPQVCLSIPADTEEG